MVRLQKFMRLGIYVPYAVPAAMALAVPPRVATVVDALTEATYWVPLARSNATPQPGQ